MAVVKHHDQGDSYKITCNCAYFSRGLESTIAEYRHGREGKVAGETLISNSRKEMESANSKQCVAFKISKLTPVAYFIQQGHIS